MRIRNSFFVFLSVTVIVLNSVFPVGATQEKSDEYIETKKQIYFENIDITISNDEALILAVSSSANFFERIKIKTEVENFNNFLESHPLTEEMLISQMKSGSLRAVAYTEAPVIYEKDHYERVSSRSVLSSEGGTQRRGYLTLTTAVIRSNTQNSAGEYLYTAMTAAEWTRNSILGGSNYPAGGDDYVLQTLIADGMLSDFSMSTEYSDGEYGEEGVHSYPVDGGSNYVLFGVKDDPLGLKQLVACLLIGEYYAPSENYTRAIHSLYTHTWRSISVTEVEVSGSIISEQNSEMGINITFEPEERSWNLFSNVVFNF